MRKILNLIRLMLMASVVLTALGLTSCNDDKEEKKGVLPEEPELFTPEYTALETSYKISIGETLYSLYDLEFEYVDAEGATVRTPITADRTLNVTIPAANAPENLEFRLCCKFKEGIPEVVDNDLYDYVYTIVATAKALDQKGEIYGKFNQMVKLSTDTEVTGRKFKQFSERGFIAFSHIKVVFRDADK